MRVGSRTAVFVVQRELAVLLLVLLNTAIARGAEESKAVTNPVAAAEQGMASWYGEEHRGKLMANGKPFDPDRFTAASWFYPLGTRVRVTVASAELGRTGLRSVVVKITDRGPARELVRAGRVIDLSCAAFKRIAAPDLGLLPVTVERLKTE